MTPPTFSPWLRAFEALARLGFARRHPPGSPGTAEPNPEAVDCNGDKEWQRYRTTRDLYAAWSPPPVSPWSGYAKPTLFASFDADGDPTPAGWPSLDRHQVLRQRNLLPEGTAVVLDLPGAWSAALAAGLARTKGLQPVVLANNWPHPRAVVRMEAMRAALLHYAPWAAFDLDARPARAAPVFVLDRDRLGRAPSPGDFDNRYFLQETDLPSPSALKRGGVERVLYVHPAPGSTVPPVQPAVPPGWLPVTMTPEVTEAYVASMQSPRAAQPAAAPPANPDMDDINGWLVEVRKSLGLGIATATPASWALGPQRDFAPAPRKTVFSTVKDPAFAGFRRAAAGGFGRLVPEPSSGGSGGGFG